jgi:hypothetical protein
MVPTSASSCNIFTSKRSCLCLRTLFELQLRLLLLLHCTCAHHTTTAGKTLQTSVVQQLRVAHIINSSSSSSGLAAESGLAVTHMLVHVLHIQRTLLFLQGESHHVSDRWVVVLYRVRTATTPGVIAAALLLALLLLLLLLAVMDMVTTAAVMVIAAGAEAGVIVEVVMIHVMIGVMTEGSGAAVALNDDDTL